jgi:hypothetical protein
MFLKKISSAFSGGIFGALVDSFNVWLLAHAGITSMIGISFTPTPSPNWLYPRLIWGGIWALLLVLPLLKNKIVLRGILMSLFPSTMMLFKVMPTIGKGLLGLKYGTLFPLMVLLLNCIYGIIAAFWYQAASK